MNNFSNEFLEEKITERMVQWIKENIGTEVYDDKGRKINIFLEAMRICELFMYVEEDQHIPLNTFMEKHTRGYYGFYR